MHRGCFVWTPTPSLAGRRTTRPGPARLCVCVPFLAGSGRPASRARSGAPQLFSLAALSFCFARPPPGWGCPFLCRFVFFLPPLLSARPSCLLRSFICGPGCLGLWRLVFLSFPPRRPVLVFFSFPPSAPPLSLAFFGFRPRLPWASALCVVCFLGLPLLRFPCALVSLVFPAWPLAVPWWLLPPPPPFRVSWFSSPPLGALFFFFFLPFPFCAPVVSGFLWCPAPGALGFGAVCCLLCWPTASSLSVCFRLFCVVRLAVGCSLVAAAPPPPPPFRVSRFSSPPLGAVCRVLCCAVCPWVRCCTTLRRVVASGVVLLCAVLFCSARFGAAACCAAPCGAACRPVALCFAALCFAVFPRAMCSVLCVFSPGVLVRAVVRRCALCCVCPGSLCCAFPVPPALCGAVLPCAGAFALCCSCGACCCWHLVLWCVAVCCAVSFGVLWCSTGSGGPWSSAGGVFRCPCPCLAVWSASLWLVWFAVLPCLPVSCSVVLCCCALLSLCGVVGACFALLWPVVLCSVALLVVCAAFCLVVVSACCGALSLHASTHEK